MARSCRQSIVRAVIWMGMVLSLALFCPQASDAERVKVVFLHYWTGAMSGGIDDMVGCAEPGDGDIEIVATGFEHESFKVGIRVMLDSGRPPDMFSYWAGARIQALVDQGQLAPIDDVWQEEELDQVFSPAIRKVCLYDGHMYGLPVTQHYVAMFYNKGLFERYGLAVPEDWESFLTACRTLRSNGVAPIALGARDRWPAQFWFDYLLLRTAGYDYRERLMQGQASYTDEEVAHVFELLSGMFREGLFMANPGVFDWSEAALAVYNGEAAMTLMGSWIIGLLDGQLGWQQGRDFDFFSMPVMDPAVPKAALGPIDTIVVAADGNREDAKQAIRIFAEPLAQQEMSLGSGALSPHLGLPENIYSDLQLRLLAEVENSSVWAFNYDLATPPEMAEAGLDMLGRFVESPTLWAQLLEEVQARADAIFDR